MKKIVAVNASPRTTWNTAQLVHAAAAGAADAGAQIEVVDLYELEPFMGCRSCFGCMLEASYGKCAYKDGLTETLQKIREADGLILGSPIYFSRPTAGYRALLERLLFQYSTYQGRDSSCNKHRVPVLLILTSNISVEEYEAWGYHAMIAENASKLEMHIGSVTTFTCGNTLQTDHYERYSWTQFDVEERQRRHEEVFPQELAQVRALAAEIF